MFKRLGRRTTILALLGSLVVAGAAIAYFTSGNSQATGGQQVGTAQKLDITGPTSTGALYPGESQTLTFTVSNNSDHAVQYLGGHANFVQVWSNGSGSPLDVTVDGTTPLRTTGMYGAQDCLASWFSASDPTVPAQSVPAHSAISVPITVAMSNASVAQDVCQGKIPLVNLSVN